MRDVVVIALTAEGISAASTQQSEQIAHPQSAHLATAFTALTMRDRFRLHRMDFCTWLWKGSLSVFMYGGRFAIFLSFGLAIVALIIEGGRDRKSILTGAAAPDNGSSSFVEHPVQLLCQCLCDLAKLNETACLKVDVSSLQVLTNRLAKLISDSNSLSS